MIRTRPAAGTFTLAVNPDNLTVRSVITTADPDRAGDVIVPTGLRNLDDFLINPVVLWAHNRTHFPPIGTCNWIDVQPNRVVAETQFANGFAFAEDVFRLYERGVLRGWSIGFVPRKATAMPAGGMRVSEWELLEYSAVPIPENPAAMTVALEKGWVTDPTLRAWFARLPASPPRDVLAALVADDVRCSE